MRLSGQADAAAEPSALPDFLSCFPSKLKIYEKDEFFLAGQHTLTKLQARGEFSMGRLWTLGSVLLKADTMLRGNGLLGIRFLQQHGYHIRAISPVRFTSDLVLDLWRHSLGRLSHERILLLQRLQAICPSLYMVVEAPDAGHVLPGSLRVTELKGQALLADRDPNTLRSAMGDPQSAFFNFVHTADEPADFIRELGLLFDIPEREELVRNIFAKKPPDAEKAYLSLAANSPKADLDFSRTIDKLNDQVITHFSNAADQRDKFLAEIEHVHTGATAHWRDLAGRLDKSGIFVDELDEITILGRLIALKQPAPAQPFPSCEARHWADHRPVRPDGAQDHAGSARLKQRVEACRR